MFNDISFEKARIRNLKIKICRYLIDKKDKIQNLEGKLNNSFLKEKLFFKQYDIKELKSTLITGDSFNKDIPETINRIIKAYEQTTNKNIKKTKQRFFEEYLNMNNKIHKWEVIKEEDFDKIIELVKILHYYYLPIYSEEMIQARGFIPEDNIDEYYRHFHALEDLKNDIGGKGISWKSTEGDCNLDKELRLKFYNSKYGHNDSINFLRKYNGWEVINSFSMHEIDNSNYEKIILEIIKIYNKINEKEKVIILLEKAEELTLMIGDSWKRNEVLIELINTYIEINEKNKSISFLEKAEELTLIINDSSQRIKAISKLAKDYYKIDEKDKVKALLKKAEETAMKIDNSSQRIKAISELAKDYYEIDEKDKAKALLEKAGEITLKIDDSSQRIKAISKLAKDYYEIKEYNIATMLIEKEVSLITNIDDSWKSDNEKTIVRIQNEIKELLKKVIFDDFSQKIMPISKLVKYYYEKNEKNKATVLLNNTEETTMKIDNSSQKTKAISELAECYIEINEKDKAKTLLEKAEEITLIIDDSWKKSVAILEIAGGYIKLNKRDKAISFLEKTEEITLKIDDSWKRNDMLIKLINAYIEINEKDKAMSLLYETEKSVFKNNISRYKNKEIYEILEQNNLFYPKKGLINAFKILWNIADKNEMKIDELQKRIDELGQWIDIVNESCHKYQPDWAVYY